MDAGMVAHTKNRLTKLVLEEGEVMVLQYTSHRPEPYGKGPGKLPDVACLREEERTSRRAGSVRGGGLEAPQGTALGRCCCGSD